MTLEFTNEQEKALIENANIFLSHCTDQDLDLEEEINNLYNNQDFFNLGIGLLNDWLELGFTEEKVTKKYLSVLEEVYNKLWK